MVQLNRRKFLKTIRTFVCALIPAVMGLAGLKYVLFTGNEDRPREFPGNARDKVQPGTPLHIADARIWLVKDNEGKITALDDRCTHLKCRQKWNPDKNIFECPCHGSEFDSNGKVLRGPATKPVETLKMEEKGPDLIRIVG
jgi:Rieske Fe-S protein